MIHVPAHSFIATGAVAPPNQCRARSAYASARHLQKHNKHITDFQKRPQNTINTINRRGAPPARKANVVLQNETPHPICDGSGPQAASLPHGLLTHCDTHHFSRERTSRLGNIIVAALGTPKHAISKIEHAIMRSWLFLTTPRRAGVYIPTQTDTKRHALRGGDPLQATNGRVG